MQRDTAQSMESNAMETPSGEVEEVEDTPAAFDEYADCDDEGLLDEQEDAACDKEHAAPEAGEGDDAADAIDEGDAPNDNEPVSEIMFRVLEDAACDKEHAAPDAGDGDDAADAIDEGDAPNEPVSEIMLRVLEKNRLGTWFSCQRARFPLWAFYCHVDASLTWEQKAKCTKIDCLICYAKR